MEIKCWYSLEGQQIFHPCSLLTLSYAGRSWFVTGEAPPLEVSVVPARGKGSTSKTGTRYSYRESSPLKGSLPSVHGWKVRPIWWQGRCVMEEGTRSSLTSHFPDSTFQILDKKGKSEVSRRKSRERRMWKKKCSFWKKLFVYQQGSRIWGLCTFSKTILPKGPLPDGKLILVFYCDCQRHRWMHSHLN